MSGPRRDVGRRSFSGVCLSLSGADTDEHSQCHNRHHYPADDQGHAQVWVRRHDAAERPGEDGRDATREGVQRDHQSDRSQEAATHLSASPAALACRVDVRVMDPGGADLSCPTPVTPLAVGNNSRRNGELDAHQAT